MLRMSALALVIALGASAFRAGFDAACAQGREPITTGSISAAKPLGGLEAKGDLSVRVTGRFSPFLEEGLVKAVPPARQGGVSAPVPAYLRDLYGWAEPP